MKKFFTILISIFVVLAPSYSQSLSAKKSLVVFYSFSNNTRTVANRLAELTGSDIYEVKRK